MEKIQELQQLLYEVKSKMDGVNLWLKQKETVEYYNYIQNGGNSRTAKDKVVDELKMNNDEWMSKEDDLRQIKAIHTYLATSKDIIIGLINNNEKELAGDYAEYSLDFIENKL